MEIEFFGLKNVQNYGKCFWGSKSKHEKSIFQKTEELKDDEKGNCDKSFSGYFNKKKYNIKLRLGNVNILFHFYGTSWWVY